MATSLHAEIRSAMRALVRSQRVTFQNDVRARKAARQLNRALLQPALDEKASQEERSNAILGAHQAAQYFRQNVLQGVQRKQGDRESFQLRIHAETALGDNDSIKKVAPAPSLDEIRSTMKSSSSDPTRTNATSPAPPRRRRRSQSADAPASASSSSAAAPSLSRGLHHSSLLSSPSTAPSSTTGDNPEQSESSKDTTAPSSTTSEPTGNSSGKSTGGTAPGAAEGQGSAASNYNDASRKMGST